jgi:hypothetical protein
LVLHETEHKTGGFFVEFGAADGLSGSNTLLLEREFGWRGILAEPNPSWHAGLETVSLNDLLECHEAPRTIDYVSIDTEGSELAILEQFDFTRWDVTLFSIEHNLTKREQAIDRLMSQQGYERRYASYSNIDGWYRKIV